MNAASGILIGVLALGMAAQAQAGDGEGLDLPRLQGRVKLGIESATAEPIGSPSRLSGASVLGDYYFGRYDARDGDAGGFRATSGVFLGSQLGIWGGPTPTGALAGGPLTVERHTFSLLAPTRGSDFTGDSGLVPYVGVGYSGSSLKGGWGFSADLGLMALNPGGAARLGRTLGGGPSLEDVLREMRMSPLVQFGASYSF